ncbi:MAG: opacity family porin [Sideroxydans sp.]|nr:opacity family porin [Sideroxydans sp.]
MKKIIAVSLLSVVMSSTASAAGNSVGVNYGLDWTGVLGLQAEFDISKLANNAPLAVQVVYKNYSSPTYFGGYKYSYTGFGAAAIYDFSSAMKLADKKIKPYAGLGLMTLSSTWSGPAGTNFAAANSGGLYFVGGARYALTPQFDADLNYNNFGGLTIGANFKF